MIDIILGFWSFVNYFWQGYREYKYLGTSGLKKNEGGGIEVNRFLFFIFGNEEKIYGNACNNSLHSVGIF